MIQKHLLLIDGDNKNRKVLETSLKRLGLTISSVASAELGIESIKNNKPCVVVCETNLVKMSGFEFCEWLKQKSEMSDIGFIFVSNNESVESKVKALKLGVNDYLVKPIFAKDLCMRVQMLIQRIEQKAAEANESESPKFSGDLSDLGIVDLIQAVETGKKNGAIHLERNINKGVIYFNEGRVIDAETKKISGEEALFRLMRWEKGFFEVVFNESQRKVAIETPTQTLLMEGLRRLDEWNDLLAGFPDLNSTLGIVYDSLFEKLAGLPDELNSLLKTFDGKIETIEVIDNENGNDLETLENIVLLYEEGLLEQVNQSLDSTHSLEVNQIEPLLEEMNANDTVDVEDDAVICANIIPGAKSDASTTRSKKGTNKNLGVIAPQFPATSSAETETELSSGKNTDAKVVQLDEERPRRSTKKPKGLDISSRTSKKTLPPPPPVARIVVEEKRRRKESLHLNEKQDAGAPVAKLKLEKSQKPTSLVVEEVDKRKPEKAAEGEQDNAINSVQTDVVDSGQLSLFSSADSKKTDTRNTNTEKSESRGARKDSNLPLIIPLVKNATEGRSSSNKATLVEKKNLGGEALTNAKELWEKPVNNTEAKSEEVVPSDFKLNIAESKESKVEETPAPLDFEDFPKSNRGTYALVATAIAAALLLYFGFRSTSTPAVADNKTESTEVFKEKDLDTTLDTGTEKTETQSETTSEVNTGKAEALAKAEVELKAEELAKAEAKLKAEALAKVEVELKAEELAKAEAKLKAEALAKAEAKLKAEALAKAEAELKAEALAKAEADLKAKSLEQPAVPKKDTHVELLAKAKKLKKTDKAQSLKLVNKALDEKNTTQGKLFKAELLMAMGKTTEALQILLPMTQRGSGKSKGWYLRGNAHKKLGQRPQAQQAYAKCLMLSPSGAYAARAKKALASL